MNELQNLTLTSVVFEFLNILLLTFPFFDLTLTSVVFEFVVPELMDYIRQI